MSALVQPSEIHRYSIEDYHLLVESGGLHENTHVELIDGLVVDMSPRTPAHERAIRWLARWLYGDVDLRRFDIMVNGTLTLDRSEPEPDLAVIDLSRTDDAHPPSAYFAIEVAVSSRDRDLRTKPAIYAPAVDEYWVVDLERSSVVVHRDPLEGAYRDVTEHPRGDQLTPTALELAAVDTDALFATAFAEHA